MKVVFVSNYYNHHQAAVSQALYTLTDGQYTFVQTEEMEAERKNMGWDSSQSPSFVKCSYSDKEARQECLRLIKEADLVIAGGSPTVESLIQGRIKSGKLLFRYSERVYKNEHAVRQRWLRGIKYHLCNFPYKNVYLLCASAYAAADYAKTRNFVGKAYKWGYFPEMLTYGNMDALLQKKTPASILWVARMIDWKHPEVCLAVAKKLQEDGYAFSMDLIGSGVLADEMQKQIEADGLADCVHLLGSMKPEEVRAHMEGARIFLFTSDFNEGWGAVLNESMNSGCAVVASHAIGASPYLLQNGKNGLLYKDGDTDDLYRQVKYLLDHPEKQTEFGKNAYETLAQTWNARTAAERVLALAQCILSGDKNPELYESGPCSRAEVLENNWY